LDLLGVRPGGAWYNIGGGIIMIEEQKGGKIITEEQRNKNRESKKLYMRRYRATKTGKDYMKRYREKNKEKAQKYNKEYSKKYREENRERILMMDKIYREENKERIRDSQKLWSQSRRGRYSTYIRGAEARGINFELTMDEFLLFWQLPCIYCQEEITTIGLDRVNNSAGYELSNIDPCCYDCNKMKGTKDKRAFLDKLKKMCQVNFQKD
jgi:hypothetical protein